MGRRRLRKAVWRRQKERNLRIGSGIKKRSRTDCDGTMSPDFDRAGLAQCRLFEKGEVIQIFCFYCIFVARDTLWLVKP